MGLEARCSATFGRRSFSGTALLETDQLVFRATELKLSIPFAEIARIEARGGVLRVASARGAISLSLGSAAPKWAAKIEHPPSRLEKLGVRPGRRISVVKMGDGAFVRELEGSGADVGHGRPRRGSDAIFCGISTPADLTRIERLKQWLDPAGALWLIRPKGRPDISEAAVREAGRSAGLVDVKVVRFSATHTAEKFVLPLASRRNRGV